MPRTFSSSSSRASGSRDGLSILFMKVKMGMPRILQTSKSLRVWLSMPLPASITMMAASTAVSTRYVSSEKSRWPGVSSRLMRKPSYSKLSTVELMEIPRLRSSSIQSEVVARWFFLAVTEPASWTAPP